MWHGSGWNSKPLLPQNTMLITRDNSFKDDVDHSRDNGYLMRLGSGMKIFFIILYKGEFDFFLVCLIHVVSIDS